MLQVLDATTMLVSGPRYGTMRSTDSSTDHSPRRRRRSQYGNGRACRSGPCPTTASPAKAKEKISSAFDEQ